MDQFPSDQRKFPLSKKSLISLVVALLIIAGVVTYFALKQDNLTAPAADSNRAANLDADTMPAKAYSQIIANPDAKYTLTIKDHKLVSGPSKITVKKGQSVNVDFMTPGEEVDVELEGYAIITETNSAKGASGGFHFIADKTGTFKFFIPSEEEEEAEGTDEPTENLQLGTITVLPN